MTASYAPVNLDHRLVLLFDAKLQPVAYAIPARAMDGGFHRIAALAVAFYDGPLLPEEEIGPVQRRLPWQAVRDAERLPQGDSHFPVDPGEIVSRRCDDTGTAHKPGSQVL